MNIAPEPILKAGLMTLHWATVLCRNLACRPDAPVKMLYELMDAIHEVPSILMHWNEENSLDMLVVHLSCFNQESGIVQVGNDTSTVPSLVAVFRDRLQEFSSDEGGKQ